MLESLPSGFSELPCEATSSSCASARAGKSTPNRRNQRDSSPAAGAPGSRHALLLVGRRDGLAIAWVSIVTAVNAFGDPLLRARARRPYLWSGYGARRSRTTRSLSVALGAGVGACAPQEEGVRVAACDTAGGLPI